MKTQATLDNPYLNLLKPVSFRPVFVLGSPRSGTTVLYQLLAKTEYFNYVNAYHLVNYNELLFNFMNNKQVEAQDKLDKLYASLGVTNRIFDHVKVDSEMPKEYRTIWQNRNNLSPFKLAAKITSDTLFQKKCLSDALFDFFQLNQDHLPFFNEICKKIQFISDPEKALLLKNPSDFSNFIYIKSLFPDAKFVFIHRHPLSILNSQLNALYGSLHTKNANLSLHSSLYHNLFNNKFILSASRLLFLSRFFSQWRVNLLSRLLHQQQDRFISQINSLQDNDYINVKYEDLCEDPNRIMSRILKFLEIKPGSLTDYRNFIQPRELKLLPELELFRQKESYQNFKQYAKYHDYTL